ncbi:MAG: hypothetical protein JWN70_4188 [Planctomycetaceae bacterium]|nr:hypothetical protein [Planctomycetaceae bacterium]
MQTSCRIILGICSLLMSQGVATEVRTAEDRENTAAALYAGKLAPDVEDRTILSLTDFLNPSDGNPILYAYRNCAKRRPGCIDAVVPQMVHSIKVTQSENFFCDLCDILMQCEKISPESIDSLAAVFEGRQDLLFGSHKLAGVLTKFGQGPNNKLEWLKGKLGRPFSLPVVCAAEALGRVGPSAAAAVPELERLLTARAADIRVAAASALWRIGYPDKRDVLVNVLRASLSETDRVMNFVPLPISVIGTELELSHRDLALYWLGEIGNQSPETADQVAAMLKEAGIARKLRVMRTLVKFNQRTDRVFAALRDIDRNSSDRVIVLEAQRALKALEGK